MVNALPDDVFATSDAHVDVRLVHDFIADHLAVLRELQIMGGVPNAVSALDRLGRIFSYFESDDFWSYSEHAAQVALAAAEAEAAHAADRERLVWTEAGIPPPEIERRAEAAARQVTAPQILKNQRADSHRNGLIYVLRATGHPAEADEVADLWANGHGNDARLAAFVAHLSSSEFGITTAAFMRAHEADIRKLAELTDRSGPANENRFLLDHGMRRTGSVTAVTVTIDGSASDIRLPIAVEYTERWLVEHPCDCAGSTIEFSSSPRTNWHPITRLSDRFRTLDFLEKISSLLPSAEVIKLDTSPLTFVTDATFTDRSAPIYAAPHVSANYSFCDVCGSEFLTRFAEAAPRDPDRDVPQGTPGKIVITEIVRFRVPHSGSFLEYVDDHLI